MPGKKSPYDEAKVEKIKTMLELFASRNQPQPYEIFVDKFKVVNKTTDTEIFDDYLNHIDKDTDELRIKVYNTDNSPRNDQYVFNFKPEETGKGTTLSGFEQMEQMVNEKLTAKDKEYEARRCQEKLEDCQEKLADSEAYVTQLEELVEMTKNNRYKLNKFNLVEFGGYLLERLAEKNAPLLKGIGLGGLFGGTDNPAAPGLPEPEGAAGFQKKAADTVPNEKHIQYIAFMEQLVSKFTEPQMVGVISILNHLMEHPDKVDTVTQLLN
jgi:hypothetical protein